MANGMAPGMSTRALVGHYTDDGAWRAVWVHWDGGPEELGARLVRAVELHGGDPRPVLDHVFSTKGWSSWPDDPDGAFYEFGIESRSQRDNCETAFLALLEKCQRARGDQ